MNFWRFLSCRQTAIRLTHYAIEIDKKQNIGLPFGVCPMVQVHKARRTMTRNMVPTPQNIVLQLTSWLLLSLFHPYTSHISVILKSIHYRYIDNRPWKRLHLNSGHVPPHADESPVPRVCCSCIVIWFDIYFSDKIPINPFLRDIEMS